VCRHDAHALLQNPDLVEELASVEHERWSHWQRYLHAQCVPGPDGSLVIPAGLADRWATQMNTPYAQLSEKEKESDREQVQRYLPVIAAALEAGPPAAAAGCGDQP
jgi:hypothetical protein